MRGLCFAVFATAVLSACSATKFNGTKDAVLDKAVFASEAPTPLPPNIPDETIALTYLCSNNQSAQRTNFLKAIAEGRPVLLNLGKTVCSTDAARIKILVAQKRITSTDVNALCPTALADVKSLRTLALVVDGYAHAAGGGSIALLYDINQRSTDPESAGAGDVCDKRASPLVIHLDSDPDHPRAIALTAPADGVMFDLLGRRNGHQPVRISWFTNLDYGFLTLPDARGRVRGIDELFGNNTSGPDGAFAANGYAALAKHDANLDGRIDRDDPVYRSLRVWIDRDFDGIARPRELIPLEKAGIAYVDLNFRHFEESDDHGNSTQMKSVVGLRDGSYDLIFDLWFNVFD